MKLRIEVSVDDKLVAWLEQRIGRKPARRAIRTLATAGGQDGLWGCSFWYCPKTGEIECEEHSHQPEDGEPTDVWECSDGRTLPGTD